MIQEREVITLLLGFVGAFFTVVSRASVRRLPGWELLVAAYGAFLLSWFSSVAEDVFWRPAMNFLQHGCLALGTLFVAVWCQRMLGRGTPP